MIVEGGYNLPEGTPVRVASEKAVARAEPAPMSVAFEPETESRADGAGDQPGRPGQALLRADRADDHPPDRLRRGLDAADAQRHLSGSGVPADRGHRPIARPRRQGRRGGRHPADRGGGEHRAGGRPGALEVGAGCRRALDRLRPRHRHDPGAQRRPRPHGRGRGPTAGRAPRRSPSAKRRRSSRSSRSSSPAAATRRRSTTTPITT